MALTTTAIAEVARFRAAGLEVPLELEEAALREELAADSSRGRFLYRLVQVLRLRGAEVPAELEARAVSLRFAQIKPSDSAAKSAFAREVVVTHARLGLPIPEDALEQAYAIDPGPEKVGRFLSNLEKALSGDPLSFRQLADQAHASWPKSPAALYFSASCRFDDDRAEEALAMLAARMEVTRASDQTVALYARSLSATGRDAEMRAFVAEYFAISDTDLWRSRDFHEMQAAAIARGIPAILLITQMKSGTVFTETTLMRGLKAPRLSICAPVVTPRLPDMIPTRCADLGRGGAICSQHLPPAPVVLETLAAHGIRRFLLNFRDVRQAALSAVLHNASDENVSVPRRRLEREREQLAAPEALAARYLDEVTVWGRFQESWLEFVERDTGFDVLLTDFDDLRDDEAAYFDRILGFFNVPPAAFDRSILAADKEQRAGHFRRGEKREWETALPPHTLISLQVVLRGFPRVWKRLAEKDRAAGYPLGAE